MCMSEQCGCICPSNAWSIRNDAGGIARMVTDAPLGRLSGISGRMDRFPIYSPSSLSQSIHYQANRIAIPKACDFFDLFEFSAYSSSCIQAPRQSRHPERSASQICRVTQRLWRAVEGPRRCLIYPCCSELFNHGSPSRFFPGAENQEPGSILLCPASTSSFARPIPSSKMTTVHEKIYP